ncbi:MAG: threonine-phosphate decarboxylase CobD [Nitrospira sp.]|nr:threonine-phosphate decarboxylase [Candidatus Manganitrophaceae bacterium]HIL35645.1 threonine-phosphate decarboxylase [Candidatus Manganitrophaceae bacterium]
MSSGDHGGNVFSFSRTHGCCVEEVSDFSASINPLGMSPLAIKAIQESLRSLVHYPDQECIELREVLAQHHEIKVDKILVGNGLTGLIRLLPGALRFRKVLIPVPSFSEYEAAADLAGCHVEFLVLREEARFQIIPSELIGAMARGVEAIFLCNPNNPTGHLLSRHEILKIVQAAQQKEIMVILDEAFIDYAEQASVIEETPQYPNLIVLRSFTSFFAMPGLRIGYLVANREIVSVLEKAQPPWSVNYLAEVAARESLKDASYIKRSCQLIEMERIYLFDALSKIPGVDVYRTEANFILFRLLENFLQVESLETLFVREKILIRNCASFRGLNPWHIRIAIKSHSENQKLVRLLRHILNKM